MSGHLQIPASISSVPLCCAVVNCGVHLYSPTYISEHLYKKVAAGLLEIFVIITLNDFVITEQCLRHA
jgi:hypothetical protein